MKKLLLIRKVKPHGVVNADFLRRIDVTGVCFREREAKMAVKRYQTTARDKREQIWQMKERLKIGLSLT